MFTDEKTKQEITNILQKLAEATLKRDTSVAKNMLMTSQSSKVYSMKGSLLDIKNMVGKYENSDYKFVHLDKDLDEAKFRVTIVWKK